MTERKKCPTLKSLKVKTNVVSTSGYKEVGDYQSNSPHGKTPATPEQTAVTVAREMARLVSLSNNGGVEMIEVILDQVAEVWKWKESEGYENCPEPRQALLQLLAKQAGYQLVPLPGVGKGHLVEEMRKDAEETRDGLDYKAIWARRWEELCANPDGTLNLDAIQRELADYTMIMGFYGRVLEHVTDGRISYLTTWPSSIISVVDDIFTEHVEDEVKEALEDQRNATNTESK